MASNLWVTYSSLLLLSSFSCGSNSDKEANDGTVDTTEDTSTVGDSAVQDTADTEVFGECGDGIVNSPTEECDDGRTMPMLQTPAEQTVYCPNVEMAS